MITGLKELFLWRRCIVGKVGSIPCRLFFAGGTHALMWQALDDRVGWSSGQGKGEGVGNRSGQAEVSGGLSACVFCFGFCRWRTQPQRGEFAGR